MNTPAVDRGRRILTIGAWITGLLSLAFTIVVIVLGVMDVGAADVPFGEASETVVWSMIYGAPALAVMALNFVIWRALLPGIARRGRGEAVTHVVLVTLALAVASVILVIVLLTLGFLVAALFSAGSGFGA